MEEITTDTIDIWTSLLAIQWAVALVLNTTAVIAILKTKTVSILKKSFIINLTVSDMANLVTNIPVMFVSLRMRTWLFGEHGCTIFGATTFLFSIASTYSVVVIAMERYGNFLFSIANTYIVVVIAIEWYGNCKL